jgi:FkbM family methyltransferase
MDLHPNYDRFIGELVTVIDTDTVVIDVGANIGDSSIRMALRRLDVLIYAYEPSTRFYGYAEENIKRLGVKNIHLFNQAVGSEPYIFLDEKNGTGSNLQELSGGNTIKIKANRLDECTVGLKKKVKLIKIDTDGWDWDVLNSGMGLIDRDRPIIFFELQIDTNKVLREYSSTLKTLFSLGYSFFVFDNFGNYIFDLNDAFVLEEKLGYLLNSTTLSTESRIPYFDLCGVSDYQDKNLVTILIKNYCDKH